MVKKKKTPMNQESSYQQVDTATQPEPQAEVKKFSGKKPVWSRPYSIIFVVLFAAVGGYLLFKGFAATSSFTKVWDTSADWGTGILTNTVATNGSVSLAPSAASTAAVSGHPTLAPNTTNLALNRPAKASSTQGTGYEAGKATDGDGTTRWASYLVNHTTGSDNEWFYVDLGTSYNINEVKLNWETAYGKAYNIQISTNATTWTTIKQVTTGSVGLNDLTGLSGVGRYVRMQGVTRGTQWGYSLYEMEVYGSAVSGQTNIALNHPTTASSIESNSYIHTKAVDGSTSTRWASQLTTDSNGYRHGNDNEWIYVDLGAPTAIDHVKLDWEAAYAKAYNIQVSNDATTWTTVKAVTGATGGISTYTLTNVIGRYVRMQGVTRGTQWGYSLYEMEVYGGSIEAPPPSSTTYAPSGSVTLNFDAGSSASWTSLTPQSSLPPATSITYQVRTSADNSTWSSWTSDITQAASSRYIQVQANLSTTDATVTPSLNSLTLGYNVTTTNTTPTVSLTPPTTTISSGSSVVLTWSSTNATSCSANWTNSTAASGTGTVTPTATTTYTITCTGAGGSVNANAVVTVNASNPNDACATPNLNIKPYKDPTNPDALPGTLKFVDEFCGSSLDTSKWSWGWLGTSNSVQGGESECYSPNQVTVSGGQLHLKAIYQNANCNSQNKAITSGMIDSHGKYTFTSGYIEARVWLDAAPDGSIANWPAWWLDGTGTWPQTGELDIMEGLGGSASGHFHSPSGGPGFCSMGHLTGWHVFAVNWKQGSLTGYYDGKSCGTLTSGVLNAAQFLAIGEQIGGYGGQTKIPSEMTVDYVRIWQ